VHSINIERDAFPFADESMDVLMANQVLEHVKEIFWIFHQVSRSLRVGGHFVLGVPNLASLHNRVLLALGRQPTAIQIHSAHIRGYTKEGLMRFFNEVAPGLFELRGAGGSNFYPFPPFIAKPLAAIFPTMAWGCFLLLKKKRPYNNEFLQYAAPGKLETNFFVG
jgi:SAM-dependent methyltransferase